MPPSTGFPSSQEARTTAKHILEGSRFHSHPLPDPLGGVFHTLGGWLHTLGGWLAPVYHPVEHFVHDLLTTIGPTGLTLLVIALLMIVVAAGALLVVRRRQHAGRLGRHGSLGATEDEDPDELERLAGEAEHSGDLTTAIRMRFRAGLIRLASRGYIARQDTQTASDLSATIMSTNFDRLAHDLEEIVYANRPASTEDAEAAREYWPGVLEDVASHGRI